MTKNFNDLNHEDKKFIVEYYYKHKKVKIDKIAVNLDISRRAISRVLKEANINTRLKNRYILNEKYFEKIDTEAKAYILGFIYADGYVGNSKYNNIVIAIKDKEILQIIADELEFTGEIRRTSKGGFENFQKGYCLNFSSQIMAEHLRKIGLYPNKSLTIEKLPKLNKKLMAHFIRGYFDGDGSILLSHNCRYYINNNVSIKYIYPTYNFILLGTEKFLKEIINVMGFRYSKIYDTKTKEIKSLKNCAKCEFDDIFNYLYLNSTIKLQRKYNKWIEIKSAFTSGGVKQMR